MSTDTKHSHHPPTASGNYPGTIISQGILSGLTTTMANATTHRRLSNLQWLLFLLLVASLQSAGVATANQAECSVDGTCTSLPNAEDNANSCKDMNENCEFWAESGECDANANYMLRNCPNACDICSFMTSGELDKEISRRLAEKKKKEDALLDLTETPYGVAQDIKSTDLDTHIKLTDALQNMTDYMEQIVFQDEGHVKVKKECKNRCVMSPKSEPYIQACQRTHTHDPVLDRASMLPIAVQ